MAINNKRIRDLTETAAHTDNDYLPLDGITRGEAVRIKVSELLKDIPKVEGSSIKGNIRVNDSEVPVFPDSPSNNSLHGRKNGAWEVIPSGATGIIVRVTANGTADEFVLRHNFGLSDFKRLTYNIWMLESGAADIPENWSPVFGDMSLVDGNSAVLAFANPPPNGTVFAVTFLK